jgi:hypothetical protein
MMKKLTLSIFTLLLILVFAPINVKAGNVPEKATVTVAKSIDSPEGKALIARLEEIKLMDIAAMPSVQKKELRKEVRAIKGTLREMDGGIIYVSAGGLILLILLIIILF